MSAEIREKTRKQAPTIVPLYGPNRRSTAEEK